MRTWSSSSDFDLILIPASSITHVLSLEDQLDVWKTCHKNLQPGGRLVVEATMPNMASFADSFSVPPRTPVEIDIDNINQNDSTRLIRWKTTRYLNHEQRAQIRFVYEKYQHGRAVDSYIDDLVCHVFFPRELRLLFSHTGFEVEETVGDYRGRALKADSPVMIMIGQRSNQTDRPRITLVVEGWDSRSPRFPFRSNGTSLSSATPSRCVLQSRTRRIPFDIGGVFG